MSDSWMCDYACPCYSSRSLKHWESVALFCLIALVKSCRSNLGFSQVQQLELLAARRPTPTLLLIQQLHKTVSTYVAVRMQIHV